MVKKGREYKRGDFIFAKVKGYPAWPARITGVNGKKYLVSFYGTGETANLPANVLFDYAENKEKFTKSVKRKFFSEGVEQIDHDFTNNVALGDEAIAQPPPANAAEESMDDSGAADTTVEDNADTTADVSAAADESSASQTCGPVEDSDEGHLVIDEGKKPKKDKKKSESATPKAVKDKTEKVQKVEKEPTEKKDKAEKEVSAKEPRTPRMKKEKETVVEKEKEKEKEEVVMSRSGRKIRPKRYMDEVVDEPVVATPPKKRRAATPSEKTSPEKPAESDKPVKYNFVSKAELQDISEPLGEEEDQYVETLQVILKQHPTVNAKFIKKKKY